MAVPDSELLEREWARTELLRYGVQPAMIEAVLARCGWSSTPPISDRQKKRSAPQVGVIHSLVPTK
jgi:hypothetical protein